MTKGRNLMTAELSTAVLAQFLHQTGQDKGLFPAGTTPAEVEALIIDALAFDSLRIDTPQDQERREFQRQIKRLHICSLIYSILALLASVLALYLRIQYGPI